MHLGRRACVRVCGVQAGTEHSRRCAVVVAGCSQPSRRALGRGRPLRQGCNAKGVLLSVHTRNCNRVSLCVHVQGGASKGKSCDNIEIDDVRYQRVFIFFNQ